LIRFACKTDDGRKVWVNLGKDGRLKISRSKKTPKEAFYHITTSQRNIPPDGHICLTSPGMFLYLTLEGRRKFMEDEYISLKLGMKSVSHIITGYEEWIRHLGECNSLPPNAERLWERANKCLSLAESDNPNEAEVALISAIRCFEKITKSGLSIDQVLPS